MNVRNVIGWTFSAALVGAGVFLIAAFFLGGPVNPFSGENPGGLNIPEAGPGAQVAGGPADKTLTLTVPKMGRIQEVAIPYTEGDDTETLDSSAAIHLRGTGFPWQEEANVYIAGHRLGYPGTPSFLAFYDLDKLQNGDNVYLTDSEGNRYEYQVFKKAVVSPTDVYITEPIGGRNIITLQTCTLPDYSQRLVVQAEMVSKA